MRKLLSKHITAVALSAVLFLIPLPPHDDSTGCGNPDSRMCRMVAWYTPAVTYVVENGLFAGNGNGTFSPEGSMTRAMFVTVLAKIAEANVSSAPDAGFMVSPKIGTQTTSIGRLTTGMSPVRAIPPSNRIKRSTASRLL